MSIAMELVQAVEANGGKLAVDGEWLVIEPKKAGLPLVEQLRQHKAEIIDLLKTRTNMCTVAVHAPAMPQGVRLVSWSPKEAPIKLAQCSVVTDTGKFIYTTLRQLDAHLKGAKFVDGGWGLSGLLDRLAACGVVVALDDPQRALQ